MNEIIHVSTAPDGAILEFPFSACHFMKVCNPYTGIGGAVDLSHGAYFTYDDLEKRGVGQYCRVVCGDLDDLYYA